MRLKKAARNGSQLIRSPTALTNHERRLWKDLQDIESSSNKELVAQLFVQHIMSPLLGSKCVDAGVCCHQYIGTNTLTYAATNTHANVDVNVCVSQNV